MSDGAGESEGVAKRGGRWKLILLAAAAVTLPAIGVTGAVAYAADAAAWLREAGWWVVPMFVIAGGLAVGLAVAPSHLTSLLAGFIFGRIGGSVLALAIVLAGAALGFELSRRLAGDVARRMIDRTRWGRLLAAEMLDAGSGRAFFAVALARLPPQVPFALGNILAASCRVGRGPFLGGTLVGMAPRVILVAWVGSELGAWQAGAPVPATLLWAVGGAVVGFGGLGWWGWRLVKNQART